MGNMPKYHLHRKEKEITDQNEMIEFLKQRKYATIAMCRENEPYIVTLNYGYDKDGNALYFHCALEGLKRDFIKRNPSVCATVIEDRGYKMGECDHAYRSVVIWGRMQAVEDFHEKKHALDVMLNHLEDEPEGIKQRSLKSDEVYHQVGILRLDIEEMTGKQGQ
jgi:nitroimidazol reductase NimA-like FMN-containing flavoprotein (pyridoxamine 5'-phosphate oxidase superfamily)